MEDILEKLNPSQKIAVTTTVGPVLIIAGAGSGKTRALTHRVAYLIKIKNIHPRHILAVTFTNKAAGEMKERITELLMDANEKPARIATRSVAGGQMAANNYNLPTVGTFHSICVRILRREIEKIGYKSSFNIYDTQDQLALMKKTMKDLEINTDQFKPQAILGAISKAKNELFDAEIFSGSIGGYWEEVVSKIYSAYQKKLKSLEALDFDDIILLTVKIFKTYPEVLEKYQNFFRYIMVDEYQDTNRAQYTLIKLLSEKWRNLCVVGDDWQGIYSWRGADIQNILDFEKDYPDAKVIKLEQNYRSSQTILDAAYGIISKNIHRKDKKIWTENGGGHLITTFEADNERDEAEFIIREIENLRREESFKFSDFVVLYRTNAQSRVIEEAMLRASFPYRIIGGVKFYQRKEIKDIIAYLRLVQNFSDEVSLERIINEPKRGIGEKTLEKWIRIARNNNADLISAGLGFSKNQILNTEHKILNSKIDSIIKFSDFIRRMSESKNKLSLTDFIQKVYTESGYEKYLLDGTEIGEARHENAQELLTVAKKYEDLEGEEGLRLFLEEVALIADTDNIDQKTEAVHLMTLHSAKGLEFKIVFIAGLEEGILPHSKSIFDKSQLEEERRLMYVGITRAKIKVYLLFTAERNIFGSTQINAPSRFLDDIPEHLIENPKSKIQNPKQYQNSNNKIPKQEIQNIKYTMPASPASVQITIFKDGDHVRHEIFGEGMIVSIREDILTVAFKKAGLKKLSAKIAPLKKI